jgi:hypothetical protein
MTKQASSKLIDAMVDSGYVQCRMDVRDGRLRLSPLRRRVDCSFAPSKRSAKTWRASGLWRSANDDSISFESILLR